MSETPKDIDYTALREIAEKATPGPWENGGSSVTNWHDHTFEMEWIPNGQDDEGEAEGVNSNADADGAFIAAFNPQVALSLLADRARMEKALAVGRTLADAVRLHGYPVSDEHWRKSSGSMSHQARALHLAATAFRQALDGASQ